MTPPKRRRHALIPVAAAVAVLATTGVVAPTAAVGSAKSAATAAAPHHHRALHYCYGRVLRTDDGDTVNVRLTSRCAGGRKGHLMVIRNAGIQATEVSHGKGQHNECWSLASAHFFNVMMPRGRRVRLSSYATTYNPVDWSGHRRLIKYVDARIGGKWVDVQAAELKAGLAMWKQERVEDAHNASYNRDMQIGMHAKKGFWGNTARCSSKYDQGAQLQAWIVWKTNGPDTNRNANDEWFQVRNVGHSTVNLNRWKVRNGSHYYFHDKTTYMTLHGSLAPGQSLRVFAGHGRTNVAARRFYDNEPLDRLPYFGNAPMGHPSADTARGAHPVSADPGGALYLLDPAKDFRAWADYPCVYACTMPADIAITAANYEDPNNEFFRFTNVGLTRADLTGDVFEADGWTKNLDPGSYLDPGETMTLHVQGHQADTRLDEYWGRPPNQLIDSGETVWLRTYEDVTIATRSWGNDGKYNYYK